MKKINYNKNLKQIVLVTEIRNLREIMIFILDSFEKEKISLEIYNKN